MTQQLLHGDCLSVFRDVRGLDAIVTDPPAGIGFMGRGWDKDRGGREKWIAYWAERFSVARDACMDDAVGLFWALPRTSHWTATAVEDAGWRIKDVITHHFGQGWPKDRNALKPSTEMWILAVKGKPTLGIDACRVERGERPSMEHNDQVVYGTSLAGHSTGASANGTTVGGSWPTNLTLSHCDDDLACERVGTRKVRGSDACKADGSRSDENGGLWNIHAERKGPSTYAADGTETVDACLCAVGCDCGASWLAEAGGKAPRCACGREGWWACPIAEMDAQSGHLAGRGNVGPTQRTGGQGITYNDRAGITNDAEHWHDRAGGGASRFFPRFTYVGKSPSAERHAGCEDLFWRVDKRDPFGFVRVTREEWEARDLKHRATGNVHPTVKRLSLMRWLHKLTGAQRIGDICGGSGSGMIAAYLDNIDWIGAEVCPQAIEIANARLAWWKALTPDALTAYAANKPMSTIIRRASVPKCAATA